MRGNDLLKTLVGIVLCVLAIVILTGFFFAQSYGKARKSLIAADTFCPVEEPVKVWGFHELIPPKTPRRIAVVVDATDRIPEKQRTEIIDWFQGHQFLNSLERFSYVAIYQLKDSIRDEAPEFEKCKPPSTKESDMADIFFEDPDTVRANFEKEFRDVLLNKIKELASEQEKSFSPILEILHKMFASHDEVILISDLMQNTREYSLYKNSGNHHYEDFAHHSPYAQKMQEHLANKNLIAIYITRAKLKQWQNKTLREFWQTHMETNTGNFTREKTLSSIPL